MLPMWTASLIIYVTTRRLGLPIKLRDGVIHKMRIDDGRDLLYTLSALRKDIFEFVYSHRRCF